MRPRPDAARLLETARRAEAAAPPATPEAARYRSLMVAAARAIATRVAERGDAPEIAELENLTRLLGEKPGNGDRRAQLNACYGRLRTELRAGKIMPGTDRHRALYDHLRRIVLDRLAESNPKALPRSKTEIVRSRI